MNIKKIEKGDFPQFFKLLEEVNDTHFDIQRKQKLKDTFDNGKYTVFGYFIDDEIIGFIVTIDSFSTTQAKPVLYVEEFYVSPSHRNKGIGRALFDWIIEYAKVEAYCRLEWRTSSDNLEAQKFYDKYEADSEWRYYIFNTC